MAIDSNLSASILALILLLAIAIAAWLFSLHSRNVSFVDSLWSLFFLVCAGTYAIGSGDPGVRGITVLVLVAVWAIRLSAHITVRNHGQPEDSRYQSIRERNQPNFEFKSLYIVFVLQALLAWIISVPLLVAIRGGGDPGLLDMAAFALWLLGFVFEAGGDYQLSRFKADPANAGKVMDRGLWRYTRHPNYFGDACVWWAFYLFALAAGGWWTVYAPIMMTLLLLKVSGVALLEKTISDRRPQYANYIRTTNAFFPGPPQNGSGETGQVNNG